MWTVGSKCQRPQGSLYGVCVGGRVPGNTYDRQPTSDIKQQFSFWPFDSDFGSGRVFEQGQHVTVLTGLQREGGGLAPKFSAC